MIRLARLAVLLVVATLGACQAPNAASGPTTPARTYGQALPNTFCKTIDFDPIVKALDVGSVFGAPGFLDHGGVEDQWYSCGLTTMRRDGPDELRHAYANIRMDLFGQAASAAKAYDAATKDFSRPADFAADSVQRAVKDLRADGGVILVLDGNLMLTVRAGVEQGLSLAPAVETRLDELARTVLAEVRKSAT